MEAMKTSWAKSKTDGIVCHTEVRDSFKFPSRTAYFVPDIIQFLNIFQATSYLPEENDHLGDWWILFNNYQ